MIFTKTDDFDNLEYAYISNDSGGYVSKNINIFNYIDLNSFNQFVLNKSVFGTPIFKLGNGKTKILILSGIHGDELSSQLANLKLMNQYLKRDIDKTIFFIPFASPFSTMNNERQFYGMDLNRAAHINGSLSNKIFQAIVDLGINFVGDFHTTAINSNPGFEAVFSSRMPSPESFLIASYISGDVGSQNITFLKAGSSYLGAMEDECNANGIPAITGEVLSPFGAVGKGSIERSYLQMKSFLDYFGI